MPRHDSEQRLAGADYTGAIGANKLHTLIRFVAAHIALDPHHVLRRNAVGNAYASSQPSIGGLHDGVSRERRRNKHNAGLSTGCRHRVLDGIEDRQSLMGCAAPTRSDATHDVGAVLDHLLTME